MGRKNPIAAVYKLTNKQNGKVYIGESTNVVDRISSYRTAARGRRTDSFRAIDFALMEYGFDGFDVELLASSETDPKVAEDFYRKRLEHQYINEYKSYDPQLGYNIIHAKAPSKRHGKIENHKGHKHSIYTRMLKSDPVICVDGEEAMLYWSAQSCAELLDITDRSIVTRCIHKGVSNHGRYFFKLSFADRMDDAINIVSRKTNNKGRNSFATDSLVSYVRALNVANDWCVKYGFATVDIDKLMI